MTGLLVILGIITVLFIGALAMHYLVARGARASKGGVEPPPEERETGHGPPFESIERRS